MRIDPISKNYPVRLRTITIFVIIGIALLAYLFPKFLGEARPIKIVKEISDLTSIEIPPDVKMEIPDPPKRPTIPVASDEEFPPDTIITIPELKWDADLMAWDNLPPPSKADWPAFKVYDRPPNPLTPISPEYPEEAMKLGIGGIVRVKVYIDKYGIIQNIEIFSSESVMLNEAALDAVKKIRWDPARQRDKKVGVTVVIPIEFNLEN
ncbi:MAG: TonB family protein [Candidatus Marinimicrobia bacterium]|nr:TonB family protein [Candidatus Neomarinimicrobiota bacterium]